MPDDIRAIDCQMAVRQLWDYLDHELDDQRMAEVRRHLEDCRNCLSHADFDKRFLAALERVRELHLMPHETRQRVMAVLAAEGFTHPA